MSSDRQTWHQVEKFRVKNGGAEEAKEYKRADDDMNHVCIPRPASLGNIPHTREYHSKLADVRVSSILIDV